MSSDHSPDWNAGTSIPITPWERVWYCLGTAIQNPYPYPCHTLWLTSNMTTMNQVYELLNMVIGLGDSITMEKAMEFICLRASLKDVIIVAQPAMIIFQMYFHLMSGLSSDLQEPLKPPTTALWMS
jgi:hypothetical protein